MSYVFALYSNFFIRKKKTCLFNIKLQVDKSPTLAGPPPLATCPLTKNILLYGWVGVGGGGRGYEA